MSIIKLKEINAIFEISEPLKQKSLKKVQCGQFSKQGVTSSAEEGFYFEPLLQLLIDFNKFMHAYQAAGEEN